jgi:F-box/leucine-rich repeat protein 2/20
MGSPLSGSFTTLPGYSPEMQQRKNTIGSIRQVILREMIARSLKARLRQTWRRTMQNHRISIEAPFADAVLMLLNTVFYKDGELSDHFWKTSLIQDLIQKFRVGLTEDELSGSFSLYHTIDSFQLFKTFTAMVGVRINWDISQLNRPERRFMFTDIESIDCIVRPMNIVTISEGILLAMMAASETDPTQHLELLNMAENHLTNAYTATGNPLVTAELGHIRYSRMQSGSLEDRHKDAEAAFMSYAEALLQHRAEMKDSEPASVPVLARGGTLRSASTSSNAFQHNTALRLLELAFIYLPGDPNLMRLARCTQPQQLHTMIARWMLTLHRTRPKTATINPVLVLVRRIFATLNGLPLLLDSLQYAQNELMELIRAELYQTVEWKLSGQQRIFETSETSLAALVEISKLADKNFWLPHLHTLDFSCVYTLMDKHLEVILPLCPNLTSLNISGCPRLTIRLAELLPLHRMTPLQTLNISQCIGITDDFFLELKPLLRSLTNVNVSECPEITETTLFLLSRGAPNLSALAISGCTGITSFHSLEQFVNLRSLECCKLPSMDPLHLAALLRKTSPPMHRLIANGNPQLIDSTFEMMTGTTSLVEVQIAESSITSATLEIMIKFAPELEVLDISDCSKLSLDIMGERLAGFTKLKALHTRGQTHFSVGPLFTTLRDQLVALDISMSSHSVQSVLLKSTPPNLTALNISRCNDFIATALLEFGNMQSLTHLNMAGCVNVTDGVLAGLLEKVKGLTRLELAFCAQLTASAPALIGKNCPQLRILDMDSCVGIDQPRLAEIGYGCRELMELRMSRINLRNSATIKSLFRGGLSSLRVVKLKDCHMTDESLKEIASFSPALQDLDVADNPDLTNQGVKHLFQHCHFLEHLILTGAASISDDAFPKSTKRRLRSLRTLSLSGCKAVTDATISLLSRRCFLLSSLNISGCNEISADSIKALMQSAPHLCELRALVCAHIPPGSLDIPSEDRASPLLKVVY